MPEKTYPSPGHSATGSPLSGTSPRRIDAVEVGKTLRRVLRRHFPDAKFYVRTERYSGGASIDVFWVDGPTAAEVERLVQPYRGADFDGRRDLKREREVVVRLGDGTLERRRYGADFIFTKREASPETEAEVRASIEGELGERLAEEKLYPLRYDRETGTLVGDPKGGTWGAALLERVFQARAFPPSKRRPRFL